MAVSYNKLGPESLINTQTTGDQRATAGIFDAAANNIARLTDGRLVTVWDDVSNGHAKARVFDAYNLNGTEIDLDVGTGANVAALANGGFVTSYLRGGVVHFRVYSPTGTFLGDTHPLSANLQYQGVSVTGLSNGNFLVNLSYGAGATTSFAYAAEYTQGGVSTAHIFSLGIVSSSSAAASGHVDSAQLPNGNIAFAWQDTSGALHREIYGLDGSYAASGIVSPSASYASVAALSNNNSVFAYTNGDNVYFEVVGFDGTVIRSPAIATVTTSGTQTYADVAATSDGGFVITWEDNSGLGGDNDSYSIKERFFDASGNARTGEILVNSSTKDFQGLPSVVGLPNGGAYTVWGDFSHLTTSGQSPDLSGAAVKGQAVTFVAAHGDLSGDGHTDILWRNDSTALAVFTMGGPSGAQVLTGSSIGSTPDASWHIQATADFNGDGKNDILWRNDNTTLAVWTMGGATGTSVQTGNAIGSMPGASWHVQGAADFNGDGHADILWRNDDSSLAVWTMDGAAGTTIVTGNGIGSTPGPSWHVQGLGDFNGDGNSDILWRNDDGTFAVWTMGGATGTQVLTGNAIGSVPPVSWHVNGVADFNGDGRSDILLRHDNGTLVVWTMGGAAGNQILTGNAIASKPDASWNVQDTGDYNGDSHGDILWRNDSGLLAVFTMSGTDGTTVLTGNAIGSVPDNSWHVQTHQFDIV